MSLELNLIILGVLVLLSGCFSGTEAAFLSLSNLKVNHLAASKKGKLVKKLKDKSHSLIITLLIGNNLVNIGASALATAIAIDMFGSKGVGIATGVMTFIVLVVGEIVPKNLAILHAEAVCTITARPVYILQKLLYPAIAVFDFLSRRIMGSFGIGKEKPIVTEEELRSFVEVGGEIGSIEKEEKEMIQNIFRLNDLEVREIMTPRINVQSVDPRVKLEDILDMVTEARHSRFPVIQEKPEKVTGILNIKDTLSRIREGRTRVLVRSLAKRPFFVPESKKVDVLLREMQKKVQHIAIVVDEYGQWSGLVTIEDILEEIVGEIYDETDLIEENVLKLNKRTAKVKGETSIEELNKKLKTRLATEDGYDTVSGYVLKHAGRIPKEKEVLELPDLCVEILSVKENRIALLKIMQRR